MKNRKPDPRWGAALLALLTLVSVGAARAQDADPPGRVARLSDAEGSVSLQPAGVEEWTAAPLNRPITTGDRLWSDQNSRAELDMGSAVVRLGSDTGFSFFNLDDHTAQMRLTAGTLIVRVRDLQAGQIYEIDTPNLAVTLLQPGVYRVEVDEAGDSTVVKVSEGSAQADGGGQSFMVGMQQVASFTGMGALAHTSGTLGAPDDLDGWSAQRERAVEESASRGYVAEDMPGAQELDANGAWQATAEYGYVWAPTVVVVNWAPYRFGHWAWITPWGWNWIDDAPWGFAPFHYGRWVVWNSAWCWVPGPRVARPVYAPALVAWVRAPDHRRGVGADVAWFPLGPREAYVPAYRASPNYARNINNTTVINNYTTNVYQNNTTNARYVNNTTGAVTAVPEGVFTTGQRVGGHAVRLSTAALTSATVAAAAPAIAPVRASVVGSAAPTRALRPPPAAVLDRPVLARTPPPRAPVPFDRQLAAIQANGGRPLARAELAQLAPPVAAAPVRVLPATGHALARPVTTLGSGGAPATPGFVPRERAGEGSGAPSQPRENSYRPPVTQGAVVPNAPGRADRPPPGSVPQPLNPGASSGFAPVQPHYRAPGPPPSTPPREVQHPPVARPPVPAPPPAPAHAPPPAARDPAGHADTRDRPPH
jgi:hypothetical protein